MTKRPHKPTELIKVRTTRVALGEESVQIQPVKTPAVRREPLPKKSPAAQPAPAQTESSRKNKPPPTLILIGAALVVAALLRLDTSRSNPETSASTELTQMLMEDERRKLSGSFWENDEPGFFGKLIKKLCLGYATSEGCSDKPLHPFRKVYEERGKLLEFPKEPSKRVVEQEIEIRTKSVL
jgi:hypothetical protein